MKKSSSSTAKANGSSTRGTSNNRRRKSSSTSTSANEQEESNSTTNDRSTTASKSTRITKKVASAAVEATSTKTSSSPRASSPTRKTKKAKVDESQDAVVTHSSDDAQKRPVVAATKTRRAPSHQVLTERDAIPKLWDAKQSKGSYTFKVASWNVCGLRALLNKDPNALSKLVQEHQIDVLCLQETKLQESHVDDPKLGLRDQILPGYDAYYSSSTTKKGYSGTAAFVKRRPRTKPPVIVPLKNSADSTNKPSTNSKGTRGKKQQTLDAFASSKKDSLESTAAPTASSTSTSEDTSDDDTTLSPELQQLLVPERVSFSMGVDKHDGEGRMIVLDFPLFSLINVYVPNSGQELAKLSYRTDEWDPDLLQFVQQKLQQRQKPVMWLGDLNVAHTNLEVWNDGAKHLPKQAGVTPQERASFQRQLDAGFVDVFRYLHPTAKGHYSYWSQRAGNRAPNKGLRLDYFVCNKAFLSNTDTSIDRSNKKDTHAIVRDSYILHDQQGSDHCPVVVELEVKV